MYGSVSEKTAATVDFFLEIREFGKVFRSRFILSGSASGGIVNYDFRPYLIVPPNSDLRIRAVSSANDTGVDAGVNGILCKAEGT